MTISSAEREMLSMILTSSCIFSLPALTVSAALSAFSLTLNAFSADCDTLLLISPRFSETSTISFVSSLTARASCAAPTDTLREPPDICSNTVLSSAKVEFIAPQICLIDCSIAVNSPTNVSELSYTNLPSDISESIFSIPSMYDFSDLFVLISAPQIVPISSFADSG